MTCATCQREGKRSRVDYADRETPTLMARKDILALHVVYRCSEGHEWWRMWRPGDPQ